jgi:hypothetical protein
MIGATMTSAMKIVRRDHSISPSDRSKTRMALDMNDGARRGVAISLIV